MSRLKGWQRTQNNILRSKERLTRRHSVMELGTVKLPQKIPENGSLTKDWECKQHWASQLQHCKPEDNGSRPSICPGKIISNSMLSQIIIKNTLGILLHPTLNSWKSIYFLGPCSEHWSDKEIFFTITYFKKNFFFAFFYCRSSTVVSIFLQPLPSVQPIPTSHHQSFLILALSLGRLYMLYKRLPLLSLIIPLPSPL